TCVLFAHPFGHAAVDERGGGVIKTAAATPPLERDGFAERIDKTVGCHSAFKLQGAVCRCGEGRRWHRTAESNAVLSMPNNDGLSLRSFGVAGPYPLRKKSTW